MLAMVKCRDSCSFPIGDQVAVADRVMAAMETGWRGRSNAGRQEVAAVETNGSCYKAKTFSSKGAVVVASMCALAVELRAMTM